MAHCDVCCLRMSLNKDKTLPKHYSESTTRFFVHGEQKECPGSGTTRYTLDSQLRWKCSRHGANTPVLAAGGSHSH